MVYIICNLRGGDFVSVVNLALWVSAGCPCPIVTATSVKLSVLAKHVQFTKKHSKFAIPFKTIGLQINNAKFCR